MASNWATFELESIKKIKQSGQPTEFKKYGINILSKVMEGSSVNIDELAKQMLDSDQTPKDSWYDFSTLIFSAASSTSNDSSLKYLVGLVFALANHTGLQTSAKAAEIDSKFRNLTEFGWIARDLWNGEFNSQRLPEKFFLPVYGTIEADQTAWVNLNRFMAHLSHQQRLTPIEPLKDWVEDFGLWNIADGLEDKSGIKENGESAAVWLTIAGEDIYGDPTWGKRDGKPGEGIPVREGELWSTKLVEGLAQEDRWGFWKEQLKNIANDASIDVSIKEAAKKAEQAMT